jgi:WD40 repeat protein
MPIELQSIDQFDFHQAPVYGLAEFENELFSVGADRQVLHYWLQDNNWLAEQWALLPTAGFCCCFNSNIVFVGDSKGTIYVFDRMQKQLRKAVQAHQSGILKMHILKDELWSIGQDGTINIWEISELKNKRSILLGDIKLRDMCWDTEHSNLGIIGLDGYMRLFDKEWMNEWHTQMAHRLGGTAISFWSKKNLWITGGKDGLIQFWDPQQANSLFDFQAHKSNVYRILLDQEHQVLWSCALDKSVKAWDMKTWECIGKWDKMRQTVFRSVNDILLLDKDHLVITGDNKKIDVTKICFFK